MRRWDGLRPNKVAVSFCVRCNVERVVINKRCSVCKDRCKAPVPKYGSVSKLCHQGKRHQSTLEARRCNELHTLQAAGVIERLEAHPQVEFDLVVDGVPITTYRLDFRYLDKTSGAVVHEDVKGYANEVWPLKKRLMLACHRIDVQEWRGR